MRFLFIPVADALTAVRDHLARWPEEDGCVSPEERRELVQVACRFVLVTEVLLAHVKALTGRPDPN